MRSKILRIAAAGAVVAGGLAVLTPPSGADVETDVALTCSGARAMGKLNPAITLAGLQTKATTALFTDLTAPPAKLGGSCTAKIGAGGRLAANGGKPGIPGSGAQTLTLNPVTLAATLNGWGTCASPAPAGTSANGNYPLTGQIVQKYSQTYTDTVTSLPKNYSSSAWITSTGFDDVDVVGVTGIGTKGIGTGAPITGKFAFDPIKKPVKGTDYQKKFVDDGAGDPYINPVNSTQDKYTDYPNTVLGHDGYVDDVPLLVTQTPAYSAQTGYMLDLITGLGCTLGGSPIGLVQVQTYSPSLLGTVFTNGGLKWQLPA
jgi:hypothetical protein